MQISTSNLPERKPLKWKKEWQKYLGKFKTKNAFLNNLKKTPQTWEISQQDRKIKFITNFSLGFFLCDARCVSFVQIACLLY